MPADLVKRIDLDCLYPPFLEKLLQLLANCRERGWDYVAIFGYRSWAQQHQLRLAFLNGTGGRAAPAGASAHNYGLAVDLCRDKDLDKVGLQPDWDPKAYDVLGEEADLLGLHWGASYNDRPHISWPGYVNAKDLAPLRAIMAKSRGNVRTALRACWDYVDGVRP